MTRLVLDAGALLAWDRRDRVVAARLEVARQHGVDLRTTAIVLAQVWRNGARQAHLARLLKGTEVVAVDEPLAERRVRSSADPPRPTRSTPPSCSSANEATGS